MKVVNYILLVFLFPSYVAAQDTIDTDTQQKMENIVEQTNNEETDFTQLLELLDFYKKHPINLNDANKEVLLSLELLSEIQINNLLSHVKKNGNLISIHELQSIDGFDLQTIKAVLPYVYVTDYKSKSQFSMREMLEQGQHVFILRYTQVLEDQAGFSPITDSALSASPNSRYLGSKPKIFARYRFTYGTNVSWGITGEKDAGEEFFKGTQKNGFDFYSAHFFIRNVKFVRAFALGDYTVGFGQGLICLNGLAYGKTADAVNTKRNAQGIRPYSSVDENLFFRGAATTLGYKNFELTTFFSKKNIDANISVFDTANNEVAVISSLQETGLHSTASELADKDALGQMVYGGSFAYKTRKIKIGVNAISTNFSAPLNRDLDLYNQFEFTGKQLINYSFDYSWVVKNVNFYGETAMSDNGGMAMINGLIASLDQRLSASISHRYYQKNYQALFANGFAEGTRPINETGIYMGLTARPFDFLTVNAYYDLFKFPWLRYQIDAPSDGNEFLVQMNYTPSKKLDMYFRFRTRNRAENFNLPDAIDYTVMANQKNYRFNISYTVSPSVKLKNRIEYLVFTYQNSTTQQKGFLIYQDVVYKKMGSPIAITMRYALFETDDFDSRVYVYENDMPGAFSVPSFFYRGSRTYIMLNYDVTRKIEIWLRWAQTFYSNQNTIGEGSLNEINGNSRNEIRAQVRFKF